MASRLVPLLLIVIALTWAGQDAAIASAPVQWIPDGPADHAVVWAVGDGAGAPGADAVARLVATQNPDLFLYLGDVYPLGTRDAFQTGYHPTFGRFASLTAPTPGNHDWPVRAEGYYPYWTLVHGRTPPQYYSVRAGGWQLIELNSETASRQAQLAWLREQVSEPGTCRLAFWHRPRFSAGPQGNTRDMDVYWRAMQGRARLVLSGHDHNMQRLRARGGIVQLVSGAGGKGHDSVDRSYKGLAFADDHHDGALRIELTPGLARLSFVDTAGRTLDAASVTCQPLDVPPPQAG
jgi:hypothetical protein